MSNMKLLRRVVDNLHDLADSITDMAMAMEGKEPIAADTTIPDPEPDPLPEGPKIKSNDKHKVTLEDLRELMAALSLDGKTADVRSLLLKYNAGKLSAVRPEDYDALMFEAQHL